MNVEVVVVGSRKSSDNADRAGTHVAQSQHFVMWLSWPFLRLSVRGISDEV